MNDLKVIISKNLIMLRKGKKLTQIEFANELNYSDKAISKWERAESIPDIVVLKQISDVFGVSVDYLLNEHTQKEENLVFVCANKHPLAKKKKVSLEEVFSEEFVVTEKEGICFTFLKEIAATNNLNVFSAVEIDSVAALIDLVKKDLGLAFLPEYAVKSQVENGSLSIIDVDYPTKTYFSQILCHKSRWLSPFIKGLIGLVEEIRPM